jgi:two-component system, response regulator, stage 0 sporulation protein F
MDGCAAALHTIDAPIIDVLLDSIQNSCRAQHVRQPFCSLLHRGYVRRCHEMTPHPHQNVILPRENNERLPAPHKSYSARLAAGWPGGWTGAKAGLASAIAGHRHVTVLACQGETWPRKRNARPWRNVVTARVLVVDDEPDAEPLFRQQFRREVREGLYRLDFARSGETALHMLEGNAGDEIILLLLDINVPGMSGLDPLPKIKGRKAGLPVYGDVDTVTTAQERGADEFLTKPVNFAKLRRDIMAVKADAMRRDV